MQITHQEARRLIHFHSDDALKAQEKSMLLAHLTACPECRIYAEEIKEVEIMLVPVMKKHWDARPIPLSIHELKAKRISSTRSGNLLTIRMALMSFVLAALIFSTWQFTRTGLPSDEEPSLAFAPLPTPSVERTSTAISSDDCGVIQYTIQPGDTLESIAQQFSASPEEIISMNSLKSEVVSSGLRLLIPFCGFTPTIEFQATRPTTSTPVRGSATSPTAPNGY
jgi:hypothetical protein